MAGYGYDPYYTPQGGGTYRQPSGGLTDTPHDQRMTASLADDNSVIPYLKNNTQNKLDESLTWGEMFDAAWTGAKTGVGSYAPERFYRAMRTVGTMLNSDSIQEWAAEGVDENVRERSEDPWYRPDDSWMQKEWGRALYEGFANTTAGLATMAPGVLAAMAAAPVAAGTGLGSLLLMKGASFVSGSAFSNILMGMSEFDSFVDDAHAELSRIDPNITRDTIRSDKFWQAAISGLAEGGISFGSDLIGGKLTGIIGEAASKRGGHLVTRLIRNTYSNVITEMGEEAATAAIQDYAREWGELKSEGRWQAIQNIIKPTLVAGVLGGGIKTGMSALQGPANQTQTENVAPETIIAREREARARESLSAQSFETLKSLTESEGFAHKDALAAGTVLDALANRLSLESGQNVTDVHGTLDARDPSLHRLTQAIQNKDIGADAVVGEAFEFLHNRLTPEAAEGIAQAFPDGQQAMEAFSKYLKGDKGLNLPESAEFGFSAMKNVMTDVVNAMGNNSRLSVNSEIHNVLRSDETTAKAAPVAPVVARNEEAFQQAVAADADARTVAGAVDFDSLNGNGPKSVDQIFLQWNKALTPLLDKVTDSKRRRPDARVLRQAEADLSKDPGIAKMAEYFDKAYGADKGMVVMDKILDVAGAKLEALAARYESDMSLENGLQLAVLAEQYHLMQDFRNGTASEAGRLLRMVGISRNDPRYADKIASSIQGLGGAKKLEALATALQNAKDAMERDTIIASASKAKTMDMFVEYVTSGMLWSPATHFVNALSNAANVFMGMGRKFYAEKTNTTGTGIASGETMAYMTGLWRAMAGMKRMWTKHREGQSGLVSSIKNADGYWNHAEYGFAEMNDSGDMQRAITGKNVEASMNRGLDRMGLSKHHWEMSDGFSGVVDFLGSLINIPFTALEHSDKIFKNATYVAELHALVHRASEGNVDALQRMLANPPADLKRQAMQHAKEMTFQADMGKIGKWVNELRNDVPAMRFFIPFLKTPINILKEGISMTPYVNRFLGEFQAKLNSPDAATRQMAEAKLMTGQLIWGTAVMLASAGYLTGPGPEDADERRKQLATGKRFNSIKIGDTYYQIDRLDPLAAVFNSAAFVTEIADNIGKADFTKAMLMGLGHYNLADITGIKPASLYNHFPSKDALWKEALHHAKHLYLLYFDHLEVAIVNARTFTEVLDVLFYEPKRMANVFTCYAFCMIQAEQFRNRDAGDVFYGTVLKHSVDCMQK